MMEVTGIKEGIQACLECYPEAWDGEPIIRNTGDHTIHIEIDGQVFVVIVVEISDRMMVEDE